MTEKLRIGVIGWGEIGQHHASHFESGGAILSSVLSRKNNLSLEVPVFTKLKDMLPYVDAVCVAVPNYLHASYCLEAARAGKAVFLEKPMCINKTELEELRKVLPRLKVPVHLGYRLRWNPSMIKLREQIEGLKRISCIYNMDIEWLADGKDWTRNKLLSGGAFFTIVVHSLDLARWLANANGAALSNLKASAEYQDDTADFPLKVRLSGTLPSGIEILAGADLRRNNKFKLKLKLSSDKGSYPNPDLKPPEFEDEAVEYRGLLHNFIQAAKEGKWEQSYIDEVFQTHQELIDAREIASKKLSNKY